ncbi:VOC family protein [Longispora albida]|uniref:VOC family protein n=1 Tax=Longispora albida TaxID=203523 RepID=UPI00036819DF|nr:VOC family protein [Longispora albida]
MAHLKDIVFDCHHPAAVARFWAAALDGYQVAPYDEEELARLRANGVNDPEDDPTVLVEPSSGSGPRFFFQLVPESKVVKNRVHLDLTAAGPAAEIRRLCALGAKIQAERDDLTVMTDVEGNEFCVVRRSSGVRQPGPVGRTRRVPSAGSVPVPRGSRWCRTPWPRPVTLPWRGFHSRQIDVRLYTL